MITVLKWFQVFACLLFLNPLSSEGPCESCRILTPLIKNGSVSYARTISEVNDTNFLGVRSFSGFITVNERYGSNLFFWFFPKEKIETTPWIIWLQGGPGYSSLKGALQLIGPIKIVDGKVTGRNVTWAEDYSLLFLDNPVGAGFSFTGDERGYPDNEDDVGGQMFEFLQQFLAMFPELRRAPLFIAGQSYGGKYVPALAIQVHRHRDTSPINFKGIMIGNGLIDPRTMMHFSELCRVIGILDNSQINAVRALERSVVHYITKKEMIMAAQAFNTTIEYIKKQGGVSVYNFEMDPDNTPAEYEQFLRRSDVREWLHVGNASFDLNNQVVYEKMLPDIMNTTMPWVEELLEHYGVLCYSGQLDVILAYSLSRYTYDALQWSNRELYDKAPRVHLRINNGPIIGYSKGGGRFVEALILSAGHSPMVEQPVATKFLIDRFIQEFK